MLTHVSLRQVRDRWLGDEPFPLLPALFKRVLAIPYVLQHVDGFVARCVGGPLWWPPDCVPALVSAEAVIQHEGDRACRCDPRTESRNLTVIDDLVPLRRGLQPAHQPLRDLPHAVLPPPCHRCVTT